MDVAYTLGKFWSGIQMYIIKEKECLEQTNQVLPNLTLNCNCKFKLSMVKPNVYIFIYFLKHKFSDLLI